MSTDKIAELALLISLCSVVVAAISLGWNVYRDVIRKPKLRISIGVSRLIHRLLSEETWRVAVTITNFGPGKTRANMLRLRKTSWWLKLRNRQEYAALLHDYEDAFSGKLPCDLEVGDSVDLTFRLSTANFLEEDNFNQIGISDPFGRIHWSSRKEYKRAQKDYKQQRTETAA